MASSYVVPSVLVSQEFNTAISGTSRERYAHITAPHAYLLRYSEADEKPLGLLGYYDPTDENCYSWPDRPAGAIVDLEYTKIFIDDALLQYFQDSTGVDSTIAPVANYANRIRSTTLAFKENGDSFPRSAVFLDRDVKAGDIVKWRAVPGLGGDPITGWTYVKDFISEIVAATVSAASSDDDNLATQSAASSFLKTAGADNCLDIDSTDHSVYDGLATGDISETYTIEVVAGSTDGDLATATLRVTSASGRDDVAEVTPSAAGVATAIGTRGLEVTWDVNLGASCSEDAEDDEVSIDDFIVGQTWEVEVQQAFTKPVGTSGGTYAGTKDTTYIVEVTLGGKYATGTKPQITVATTTGIDISGPTTVTAAATPISIGTQGVTISFSGTSLRKGDRYYVPVVAASNGRVSTLVLGHNLHEDVLDATDMDLTLYIKKNIEVGENRLGFAPLTNWEASTTEICLKDGIVAYESSWTDDGVEQPLDVVSESSKGYGKAYVQYRAWRSDLSAEIGVTDINNLEADISGPLDPDNPLKYAVYKAASNSNGTSVKYTSVSDPSDLDEWAAVLEILDGDTGVYGLVPCTTNPDVLDLWEAHVLDQSTPTKAAWREAWVPLSVEESVALVDATTSDDGEEVLATVTDDPNTSNTQYTLVTITSGNGSISTLGVAAGDEVRLLYTTDGFGGESYTTGVIDSVVNEDTFLLQTGLDAAVNVASKIEIWHNRTNTEQAAAIAAQAGAYACRRLIAVWPDLVEVSGENIEGYFVCAGLAGLASGVVPQQGLTNVELLGFDAVPRTTKKFNRTQLNTMAGSGVWIVTQDIASGKIYSRHAETTGDYDDINQREEMVTRNVDNISYQFMDRFAPYIGISNATNSMLDIIEAETLSLIQHLRGANFVQRLGGQLVDGTITSLQKHATFKDRITLVLGLTIPYPLNNIECKLVI